jgi:hypothetical protein
VYDYETTADLNEAIYYERLDADLLQAQYEAESRASAARAARGICDHHGGLGGGASYYSAQDIAEMLSKARHGNRGGWTGSQADIPAGKMLCTDCGTLTDDPWPS